MLNVQLATGSIKLLQKSFLCTSSQNCKAENHRSSPLNQWSWKAACVKGTAIRSKEDQGTTSGAHLLMGLER